MYELFNKYAIMDNYEVAFSPTLPPQIRFESVHYLAADANNKSE
jgi:hypothetical protein